MFAVNMTFLFYFLFYSVFYGDVTTYLLKLAIKKQNYRKEFLIGLFLWLYKLKTELSFITHGAIIDKGTQAHIVNYISTELLFNTYTQNARFE